MSMGADDPLGPTIEPMPQDASGVLVFCEYGKDGKLLSRPQALRTTNVKGPTLRFSNSELCPTARIEVYSCRELEQPAVKRRQ